MILYQSLLFIATAMNDKASYELYITNKIALPETRMKLREFLGLIIIISFKIRDYSGHMTPLLLLQLLNKLLP